MDPVRNPYAPGAGQRPPELAGRTRQLQAFEVTLARSLARRPERSLMLCGLRGVGKTVLLNELRSIATRGGWATGRLEARADLSLRRPLAHALHVALRELGSHRGLGKRLERILGILKAFSVTSTPSGDWRLELSVDTIRGRADSGDLEQDLPELFVEVGELAQKNDCGVALFLDELQEAAPDDLAALCAACHEVGQSGLPVVVTGAGLPVLPAVLASAKSYAERLFAYPEIGRLDPGAAADALTVPAAREGVRFENDALEALHTAAQGYPYFVQCYGKATWDVAPRSPITAADVALGVTEADADLAIGFFGTRFERATPVEREYLHTLAAVAAPGDGPVSAADVTTTFGRRPASASAARESLIRKGLLYRPGRGEIAFTVPHFGRYLRSLP